MPRAKTTKKASAAVIIEAPLDATHLNGSTQSELVKGVDVSAPSLNPAVKTTKGRSKKTAPATLLHDDEPVAMVEPVASNGGGRVRNKANLKPPITKAKPEKKARGASDAAPPLEEGLAEEVSAMGAVADCAAKSTRRSKRTVAETAPTAEVVPEIEAAAINGEKKGRKKKVVTSEQTNETHVAQELTGGTKSVPVQKRGAKKTAIDATNEEPVLEDKVKAKPNAAAGKAKKTAKATPVAVEQESVSKVAEASSTVGKKRSRGKTDVVVVLQEQSDVVNGNNMEELAQPSSKKKIKKDATNVKPTVTAAVVAVPKREKAKMADKPLSSPKKKKTTAEVVGTASEELLTSAPSKARKAPANRATTDAAPIEKKPRKRGAKSNAVVEFDEDSDDDGESKPSAPKRAVKGEGPLNPVKGSYNKADFGLSSLCDGEGEAPVVGGVDKRFNLKIASWNVAGLRSWVKKDGLVYLDYEEPDIFCLQETKCTVEQLPPEAERINGYHPYWLCMPGGYGGVAIYSKIMPINVEYGLGADEFDAAGRLITAEYEKFFLVNVYVPNSGRKLVNLEARMRWEQQFRNFVLKLDARKPVIICGDMNVSHAEIDLANPKTNIRNAGFTKEERDQMSALLDAGFVDSFRHLYPTRKDAYTFWTYIGNARSRNVGWRLDYFLVSQRFVGRIIENAIRSQCLGSDHCPITLFLNI